MKIFIKIDIKGYAGPLDHVTDIECQNRTYKEDTWQMIDVTLIWVLFVCLG